MLGYKRQHFTRRRYRNYSRVRYPSGGIHQQKFGLTKKLRDCALNALALQVREDVVDIFKSKTRRDDLDPIVFVYRVFYVGFPGQDIEEAYFTTSHAENDP